VQTNPGIPDWWSNASGARLPDWPSCWTPDKDAAFQGTLSMKMTNPADRPGNTMQSYGFPAPVGKVFTASVYLKSDTPDVPVSLNCSFVGSKTFKVGTQWERYHVSGQVKKPTEGHGPRFFFTIGWGKKGTIWVNAPQVAEASAIPAKPEEQPPAGHSEIKLADGTRAFVGPPGPYGTSPRDTPTTPGKEEKKPEKPTTGPQESWWRRLLSWVGLGPSVPRVTCAVTEAAPKIDGVLDDPCWKTAAHLDNFILYDSPDPAKNQTDVFITRDTQNLYIAAPCHDSDMASLTGKCQMKDGQVFNDDEIEVFLSPYKDGKDYYQFAVNLIATRFEGHKMDPSWDAEWQAWTGREDKAWTVEMAIPFKSLGLTPNISKTWRINICRHRPNPAGEEFSSWSRVFMKFHTPERFGQLQGMDYSSLERFFLDVKPEAIISTPDPALVDLKLTAINPARNFRRLEGEVELDGGKDAKESAQFPLALQAYETKTVTVPKLHALQENKKYRLTIRLANEGSHEPVLSKIIGNAQTLLLTAERPLSIRFEYSFVTDEPRCNLFVADAQDEQARKGARLNVLLRPEGSQATLGSWTFTAVQPLTQIVLDARKLPLGNFEAIAELLNAEGRFIDRTKAAFAKLDPKPNQTKVNRLSCSLIFGGKDYIPFAMGISYDPKQKEVLSDIASHGCDSVNIIFNSARQKDEEVKEALDLCQSLGLKVIFWMGYDSSKGYAPCRQSAVRWAEMFKDHPALVAWKMIDEPEGWWQGKVGTEADLLDLYLAIKKADPYHPVFTNHCGSWKRGYGQYGGLESTDVYSFDRYPIGRTLKAMDQIVQVVDDMAYDGARDGKPVAFWCQLYGSYDSPREPTPEENVCQTYLCLIHKARMIFYFVYKPMYPKLYDGLKPLGDEVRRLTPILVHAERADGITANSPSIHFCYAPYEKKRYIIAVNATDQKVRNTFWFAPPQPIRAGTVQVLFENRKFDWDGKGLKDTFAPYERHVYEME
jgi:hypothetical protein